MIYFTMVVFSSVLALYFFDIFDVVQKLDSITALLELSLIALFAFLPLIVAHFIMKLYKSRLSRHRSKKVQIDAFNYFSGKFVPIWHQDDEVLFGLKLSHQNNEFFEAKAFSLTFRDISIYTFPLTLMLLIGFLPWTRGDVRDYFGWPSDGFLDGFLSPDNGVLYFIGEGLPKLLGLNSDLILLYMFIGLPLLIWIASFIFYMLFSKCAEFYSPIISNRFNATFNRKLQRAVTGNQTHGESTVDVNPVPYWVETEYQPLDPKIAKKLTKISDMAMAKALSKYRSSLGLLAMGCGFQHQMHAVKELYSGAELIHTTYFDLEDIIELIAVQID